MTSDPDAVPRYSRQPFPAYRFIPGRSPHPTRDPDGHSYDREAPVPAGFDPARWTECEPYMYGVDLFNHGYWWEAHEAWETCWIAAGKTTPTGLFLQGLIQMTAACLKKHQGHLDGAGRLLADGLEKFPGGGELLLGIDTAMLRAELKDFFANRRPDQPRIHLEQVRGVRSEVKG